MKENKFNLEDFVQIVLGSTLLSVPLALTDEVFYLSQKIPALKVLCITVTALLVNSLYIYYGVFEAKVKNKLLLIKRNIINIIITISTVLFVVFIFDLNSEFVSVQNYISFIAILSFPAFFGGVVVDGFDKE